MDTCKLCKEGLLVHEGKCVPQCPTGFYPNEKEKACSDNPVLDKIWFPFLIAAAVVSIIACFGMCKKKARIEKGKRVMVSTQNTIVCILALISPIQLLAVLTQAIFAWYENLLVHLAVTLIVIGFYCILNWLFFFFYLCKYQLTTLPESKKKLVREGKLNMAEAKKKFTLNGDNEFAAYVKRHKCFSIMLTFISLGWDFKLNKLYYSHFYSFSVFKAKWTDIKYYRKL